MATIVAIAAFILCFIFFVGCPVIARLLLDNTMREEAEKGGVVLRADGDGNSEGDNHIGGDWNDIDLPF